MERRKRARISAILPTVDEPFNDFSQPVDSTFEPTFERAGSMFSRIGGIDGIMSMMGRMQQLFGFVQQIPPTFKVVGSFFGPKATVSSLSSKQARMKNKKYDAKSRVAATSRRTTKSR
ncbi:hypothetical protein [Bacillus sp. FJAT-28004]|uniref:hypothetical protein n=1 Tax=Bacillus sp. FJAT-28004 TaxID=1679165 RepID=UPI0006B680E9|nr:hypothetical protein [Bacillus sp. FJAT-28004]